MNNQNLPHSKELVKELSDYLSKKFGAQVTIVPTLMVPDEDSISAPPPKNEEIKVDFSIKPEELTSYLDQYIVKQDNAKAILATKICTHFNRIRYLKSVQDGEQQDITGRIKNNVLLLGPTGVGKTYMVKLIAQKIGVPFVKGDATKFSETGYVGGDVEDLVRDLFREADENLELAQYGIIYIDEIDKIASSGNHLGHDISRTGVQRALLKPMEDTDIELKVSHDPVSIIQEIEHFRKTGKKGKRVINTKNILFIMSGAFADLSKIIKERVVQQTMGFGANVSSAKEDVNYLSVARAEDLIKFGFESEFIGRLPVLSVLDPLSEEDLFTILINPNNPTILSKKLDFASYGITIKFDRQGLKKIASNAYQLKTGARGLVGAIESVLIPFEKKLPSTTIDKLSVTEELVLNPQAVLEKLLNTYQSSEWVELFEKIEQQEEAHLIEYIEENKQNIENRHEIEMTPSRIKLAAKLFSQYIMDIGSIIDKIKNSYEQIKKIEGYFGQTHDLIIHFEEDTIDYIIQQYLCSSISIDAFYRQLNKEFEYGLKLVREKSGKKEFSLPLDAILNPDLYLEKLITDELSTIQND